MDLAAYTEFLTQGTLTASTILNHISAVKAFYQWWNKSLVNNIMSTHTWKLTVKGLINTIISPQPIKGAVTPRHLVLMIEACRGNKKYTPIAVAIIFGFFGFLRISNLAPPTPAQFDLRKHTTFNDVSLQARGILLNIKWTKTHQSGKNPINIPLSTLGNSILCPQRIWLKYLHFLGNIKITSHTPLLLDARGTPLSIPTVRRKVVQTSLLPRTPAFRELHAP